MKSFLNSRFFLIISLLLFFPRLCHCQVKNDSSKFWVSAGIGKYMPYSSPGHGFNISLNSLSKVILWKIRFASSTDDNEKFIDLGILFGAAYSGKNSRLSVSGGPGFASGILEEELPDYPVINRPGPMPHPELKEFSSFALPVEAQLSLLLSKNIGMGISLFADLNFKRSFYGFNVNLELGRVK